MCVHYVPVMLDTSPGKVYRESAAADRTVHLAAWNHDVRWCEEAERSISSMPQDEKSNRVEEWIQYLVVAGSTAMKNALDTAMQRFPSAQDVFVLCDGTRLGSKAQPGLQRSRHPRAARHTIASRAPASSILGIARTQ